LEKIKEINNMNPCNPTSHHFPRSNTGELLPCEFCGVKKEMIMKSKEDKPKVKIISDLKPL
jgi:hypothetical protein